MPVRGVYRQEEDVHGIEKREILIATVQNSCLRRPRGGYEYTSIEDTFPQGRRRLLPANRGDGMGDFEDDGQDQLV